jgi:hypothetical protein
MKVKDFLKAVCPEPSVMAAIRAEAKCNRKSTLTMRQIDREIAAFRRERRLSNAASKRRA